METFLSLVPSEGHVFVPHLLTAFFLSHYSFVGIRPVALLELMLLNLLKL